VKAKAEADAQDGCGSSEGARSARSRHDAYIYAYPLVTMEYTRRVMTNVDKPGRSKAPMGQFARLRNYRRSMIIRSRPPNADTLYTLTWLDVAKEPWILSIPDMKDRYFPVPDARRLDQRVPGPGKRTTGTKAQKYAITGPGWSGTLPAGVTEYKSPTAMVWVLGRIYCTGTAEDYKAVHALQDQVSWCRCPPTASPMLRKRSRSTRRSTWKAAPRDQVNAWTARRTSSSSPTS